MRKLVGQKQTSHPHIECSIVRIEVKLMTFNVKEREAGPSVPDSQLVRAVDGHGLYNQILIRLAEVCRQTCVGVRDKPHRTRQRAAELAVKDNDRKERVGLDLKTKLAGSVPL